MRQYRCSVPGCKRKYSTPYTLKRHTQAFHLQIKRFSCPMCGRLFAYKHTMIDHKVRHQYVHHAPKPVVCIPKLTDLLRTQAPQPRCSVLPLGGELTVQLPDLDVSRKGLMTLQLLPLLCQ